MGRKKSTPIVIEETVDVKDVKPNVEEVAVTPSESVDAKDMADEPVIKLENQPVHFKLKIVQKDDEGQDSTTYSIGFNLPANQSSALDYIIGTAVERLYSKIDVAKAAKVRLFDGRKPLIVSIQSEHMTLDLGKVEQEFSKKLKLNSGERSKLLFMDRLMIFTNDLLQPLRVVSANNLRETLKEAVQLRYPNNKSKGLLPLTTANVIAGTDLSKLGVKENGVLAMQN